VLDISLVCKKLELWPPTVSNSQLDGSDLAGLRYKIRHETGKIENSFIGEKENTITCNLDQLQQKKILISSLADT